MKRLFQLLFVLALLPVSVGLTAKETVNADELQASIKRVVEKVLPASVAVAVGDRRGTFSGVIVSRQGYVLSAGHAVDLDENYRVILHDGREFKAVGIGTEPRIDMGLLKILEPVDLPVAEMGWSSTVKRNQPCVALSHSGGLVAERGVAVRFGRIADPVARNGMIRTTCLMEPGDSGGPVFDMQGRVIGIRSRINTSLSNNYEVPVDQFRRYWTYLNQAEEFRLADVAVGPDFGFAFITSGASGSERSYRRSRTLAEVAEVEAGGLAQAAGLLAGDHIVAIHDEPVKYAREAHLFLQRRYTIKQAAVMLTVKRGDKELPLSLQLPKNDRAYNAWRNGADIIESKPGIKPVAPVPGLENLIETFAGTEARLDSAVVKITSSLNDETSDALATLLAPGNLVVAKSSLVGDQVKISRDGEIFPAQIVARNSDMDLVLLTLSRKLKGGVKLTGDFVATAPLGQFLLSPHPDTEGRVGVRGTRIFPSARRESAGYLGVRTVERDGKVMLNTVRPNTPAAEIFQQGDFVLEVNGVPVSTRRELSSELRSYEPGQQIVLSALRDGKPMVVDVTLGSRPTSSRHAAEHFEGGKSIRRDGFPQVFSHDMHLRPEECGGPVFTADGKFAGLNIARFSRTRSYAIPVEELARFVKESLDK